MKVSVNAQKVLGPYCDPTRWQNSTLRYVPPVDFPAFLERRMGKAELMRVWITLDEYWDYRTGITYPDYEIGKLRYPVEELHYAYDRANTVPAPSGTRFVDYITSHSQHAEELLLNVRRMEREVSDGVITYDQYEELFYRAVEHCKNLAPNIRYVECCNEVDIKPFGQLTGKEYVAIYLRAHRAIQKLNETYNYPIPLIMGGIAEAHPLRSWGLMEEIAALLKESEIGEDPFGFYSYHMYNAPEDRSLIMGGMPEKTGHTYLEKLHQVMDAHEGMLARLGLPKRPVFLDEMGRARATGVDGDSQYNAAGVLTYLIAWCNGELGEMKPFPWCTFHNPNMQISYTWYILQPDGTYAATPNGLAMEILHSLKGERMEAAVEAVGQKDAHTYAMAVGAGEELAVLAVNPTCDSVPCITEVFGLDEGKYRLEFYRVNSVDNNVVNKCGKGTGVLMMTEEKELETADGALRFTEILDKDSYVFVKIHAI